MELSPCVCVSQKVGSRVRHVGIYYSPLASTDPDQAYVVVPNRADGFPCYTTMEELEKLLTQEGMTVLLGMVRGAMAEARLVNSAARRRKMTSTQLLTQLKRRLGVTESI